MNKQLRKKVKSLLATITRGTPAHSLPIYYRQADKGAIYPHMVFNIDSVDMSNSPRHDFIVTVDVWTKDANLADDLEDEVIRKFDRANAPDTDILPTFYVASYKPVEDEDKQIERRQIKIQCHIYEIESEVSST